MSLFYFYNSSILIFLLDSGCGNAAGLFFPPRTNMSCVAETVGEGIRRFFLSKIKCFNCNFSSFVTPPSPTFYSTLDMYTRGHICGNYCIVHCSFLQSNGISCSSLMFYVMYSNNECNNSLPDHLSIFKFGATERLMVPNRTFRLVARSLFVFANNNCYWLKQIT